MAMLVDWDVDLKGDGHHDDLAVKASEFAAYLKQQGADIAEAMELRKGETSLETDASDVIVRLLAALGYEVRLGEPKRDRRAS